LIRIPVADAATWRGRGSRFATTRAPASPRSPRGQPWPPHPDRRHFPGGLTSRAAAPGSLADRSSPSRTPARLRTGSGSPCHRYFVPGAGRESPLIAPHRAPVGLSTKRVFLVRLGPAWGKSAPLRPRETCGHHEPQRPDCRARIRMAMSLDPLCSSGGPSMTPVYPVTPNIRISDQRIADKGIAATLVTEARHGAMSGNEPDVVTERKETLADGIQ